MKKKTFQFAALAAAVALTGASVSCNRAGFGGEEEGPQARGSLRVTAVADPTVVLVSATRAANLDVATYHLTLTAADGRTAFSGTVPADGAVNGLSAGTYSAALGSTAAPHSAPVFDTPVYSDTKTNVAVTAGGTTPVSFTCRQSNVGVRFVYDPSLAAAGLDGLVPVVTQGTAGSLAYEGENAARTGYFAAGAATLTLLRDGKPLTVSGTAEVQLTLSARELWTVTIKSNANGGGAAITATVDGGTDGRDMTVTLDPPTGGGGLVIDPAKVVFSADFARCTASAPPVPKVGAKFDAKASFPALMTLTAIRDAGLEGWVFDNGYICAGALKMGNGTKGGTATTPALSALGAAPTTVVVAFTAANFEPTAADITVGATGAGVVASPAGGVVALPAGTANAAVVTADAAMKRYHATVTGATSATRIVFSSAGANRFFLDDVTVARQ